MTGTEPVPPFIWPSHHVLAGVAQYRFPVPFRHVLAGASQVMGVISGIDHRGAEWFKTVLEEHQDIQAALIIAVFAGCPTRQRDLEELLELQSRRNGRVQFRLLPMMRGPGAPTNCIAVSPRKKDAAWVLIAGASPNFGLDGVDPTQTNFVFPIEALLFDQWRRWFDLTWLQSGPLTKTTASIPALVPATGSPEATAQWDSYRTRCSEQVLLQGDAPVSVDSETGEVQPRNKHDGSVDQPPTAILGLPKLDALAKRISEIAANGKQLTIAYSSAIRPLDAPVNPRIFGQESKHTDGSITHHQTFRVSMFEEQELKEINDFRRGSQIVIEALGLPLEKGVYWVPAGVIGIIETEVKAIDEKARQKLSGLVGDDVASYVKSKADKVKEDLSEVFRRLGGKGEIPQDAITALMNDLIRRLEQGIGDRFVAPLSFSEIRFSLSPDDGVRAPWAQPAKLVVALARFPRRIAIKPKLLTGLQTPEADILSAMNIADDILGRMRRGHNFERRARSELPLLERIAFALMADRDRCEAAFMLIDGALPDEVHAFIAGKESAQRGAVQEGR